MNVILAFLILSAPFALAALLSWASHRNDTLRGHLVHDDAPREYRDAVEPFLAQFS